MKSAMAGNYSTTGTVVPVACEWSSEVFGSVIRGPCCPGRTTVHPVRRRPVHPDQPPQLPEGWEHWFRGHPEGDHGGLPGAPRPANRRERYPDPSGTRHLPAAALHASATWWPPNTAQRLNRPVDLTARLTSGRSVRCVRDLVRRLLAQADVPAVRDFMTEVQERLPAAAGHVAHR